MDSFELCELCESASLFKALYGFPPYTSTFLWSQETCLWLTPALIPICHCPPSATTSYCDLKKKYGGKPPKGQLLLRDIPELLFGISGNNKRENIMAPTVEDGISQPADLGFSVLNQQVELDINLRSRSLLGRTKIVIQPHTKDLRAIRLNSRQTVFRRLTLNGKPCTTLSYKDPYQNAKLEWNTAGVHQYNMLQRKLEGQLKDPPEEEFEVMIPRTVKIEELDPFSDEAQHILLSRTSGNSKRDSGEGSAIDPVQSSRTAIDQTARFTSIDLVIHYEVKNIRDGMHFVGWEEEDLRYPHAYTTNRLTPGAACCLFPCVDNLNSRCIWEISIKCPRTIGDALRQAPNSNSETQANSAHGVSHSVDEISGQRKADVEFSNFSEEDKALDLAVICTGDVTDEVRFFSLRR